MSSVTCTDPDRVILGEVAVEAGTLVRGDTRAPALSVEIRRHEVSRKTGRERTRRAFMHMSVHEAIELRDALNAEIRALRRENKRGDKR